MGSPKLSPGYSGRSKEAGRRLREVYESHVKLLSLHPTSRTLALDRSLQYLRRLVERLESENS